MGNAATPAPTEPRWPPLRHESRAFSRWRKRMRGTAQHRPRPERRRQKCPVPLQRAVSNISTRSRPTPPATRWRRRQRHEGREHRPAAAHPITVIRFITCSTSLALRTYSASAAGVECGVVWIIGTWLLTATARDADVQREPLAKRCPLQGEAGEIPRSFNPHASRWITGDRLRRDAQIVHEGTSSLQAIGRMGSSSRHWLSTRSSRSWTPSVEAPSRGTPIESRPGTTRCRLGRRAIADPTSRRRAGTIGAFAAGCPQGSGRRTRAWAAPAVITDRRRRRRASSSAVPPATNKSILIELSM